MQERWATLDDYFRGMMDQHKIPGAAVAIVKDGQVI